MDYDIIIVLGHESNKGFLSEIAKSRLDRAIEFYFKTKTKLLFSGGYSLKVRKNEGLSEAELMKNYAVQKMVSSKDILLEKESRDTQGNAYFTKQIVLANKWRKILVITTDLHIEKSKFFFEFIYGKDYSIYFEGVKLEISKEKLDELLENEKKSIEKMIQIYKENNIKVGEDKKIGKILEKFYSKFD
ncbi:MAG: YdcF family protein [Nanoarchaeota archaeon]